MNESSGFNDSSDKKKNQTVGVALPKSEVLMQ